MNEGWEMKTLADACVIVMGQSPKGASYNDAGDGVPLVNGPVEFGRGAFGETVKSKFTTQPTKLCKKDDLILCVRGSTTGKMNIAGFDACVGRGVAAIRAHQSQSYVNYFINFKRPEIYSLGSGSTFPNVSGAILKSLPIPIPPLSEQEEIVQVLDKAFAAIDQAKANIEQNIANAKDIFQSKLNQIFSQKGEGWVDMALEEILESQPRNGWSPPAANHSESGVPVLTLSSVTGFQFRKDKIKYTSIETDSARHYWVNNGELLITRSNTPELVGHVAIAEGIEHPTIYPDLIMRMIPQATLADTKFLYYHLRAPFLREIITSRASGANPTMKKINKSAVQTLPISLPPLSQQGAIVKELDLLSESVTLLESQYQTKLVSLDELKKSILQKAFAGELT